MYKKGVEVSMAFVIFLIIFLVIFIILFIWGLSNTETFSGILKRNVSCELISNASQNVLISGCR